MSESNRSASGNGTPYLNRERAGVSLAVDDELADLEIDGYKVVFTTRVTLMPAKLADVRPAEGTARE